MNNQVFKSWIAPDGTTLGRVVFEGITYGKGMRIHLREDGGGGRRFYLDFSELPVAIRIANESMRLASLALVPQKNESSFFTVDNSEFLNWLNRDSLEIYKDDPIFHLAILTEEWMDIICNENPKIVFDD